MEGNKAEYLVRLLVESGKDFLFRDETAAWLMHRMEGGILVNKRWNTLHNVHIWCATHDEVNAIVKFLLQHEHITLVSRDGFKESSSHDVIELKIGKESVLLMISLWGRPKKMEVTFNDITYPTVSAVNMCTDAVAMLATDKTVRYASALYSLYNSLFVSAFTIQELLAVEARGIYTFDLTKNYMSDWFIKKYTSVAKSRKWPPYESVATEVTVFLLPIISAALGTSSNRNLLWNKGHWLGNKVTI